MFVVEADAKQSRGWLKVSSPTSPSHQQGLKDSFPLKLHVHKLVGWGTQSGN